MNRDEREREHEYEHECEREHENKHERKFCYRLPYYTVQCVHVNNADN